ncbi:hypothetical protein GNP82_12870 [Aliivibrio fischeri]|uniref:Uncharacterized protein n=1 Tax=Aliivibrio fischeri TaxID=668 RepID=A0A6N3YXZ6_ALIFS|nr:hypothetical protein [Aliivibrio fischeri]MUI52987.1 hypothetical protein [Aliivibrio fischeri]MUJ20982.1 hypothetical protein [Aliivibrio fischeri]MUJ29116.1 hypothetical protein [Aliivibrio fischeri]MUK38447.1 hypothetical protein [Aliivibrio fischeri]MUK44091.1 hypothetical protein [Aliivibrio fischeri]
MKSKDVKRKISSIELVLEFLEKDLRLLKKIDSKEMNILVLESVLVQSLSRINRLKSNKIVK